MMQRVKSTVQYMISRFVDKALFLFESVPTVSQCTTEELQQHLFSQINRSNIAFSTSIVCFICCLLKQNKKTHLWAKSNDIAAVLLPFKPSLSYSKQFSWFERAEPLLADLLPKVIKLDFLATEQWGSLLSKAVRRCVHIHNPDQVLWNSEGETRRKKNDSHWSSLCGLINNIASLLDLGPVNIPVWTFDGDQFKLNPAENTTNQYSGGSNLQQHH